MKFSAAAGELAIGVACLTCDTGLANSTRANASDESDVFLKRSARRRRPANASSFRTLGDRPTVRRTKMSAARFFECLRLKKFILKRIV